MHGFRGRIGVVIEIAPQQFVSYRLRGTEVTIEVEHDVDIYAFGVAERIRFGLTRIRMELDGYLDSHEEATRPEWATEPAGEIEARRELPAGPTRELPSGRVEG